MKIPFDTASKACLALGKKSLGHFSLLFFSPNQQKTDNINQNQTLWHPGPLAHEEPPYAMLQ
jgi:hypothetical protein